MRRRIGLNPCKHRSLLLAAIAGLVPAMSARAGQTDYVGFGLFNNLGWASSANWDAGVPVGGSIANLFSDKAVNYNIVQPGSPVDITAVQIANGSSLSISTSSTTPYYLQAQGLYLGGTVTGTVFGASTSTGAGNVVQTDGVVYLDPGGSVATSLLIDPSSGYSLSNTGTLQSNGQQVAGTFTQSGGVNQLQTGSTLNVSSTGLYALSGSSASATLLTTDFVTNSGLFVESGGTIQGNNAVANAVTFINNATFNYSGGTFTGSLNNAQGATTNIVGTAIPFSGVLNNGRLTINGSSGVYSGILSGTGNVTFTGPSSAVTLTGSNTLTGTTTAAQGTLSLDDTAGPALGGQLVIDSGAIVTTQADGQLAQSLPLTVNGGSLILGGFAQNVSSLSITGGSIQQSSGTGLGVSTGIVTVGKGTASITGGLESAGGFTFNVATGGTVSVAGTFGEFNTASAVPSLTLNNGGTLIVSGDCPLSSIAINVGTLQFSAGGTLGGVNSSVTLASGGILNLNNQSLYIGDLYGSGRVALGSGTLTINSVVGSTYTGEVDGSGGIIKLGTGTLSFSGSNQWTGQTNISAGTLVVSAGTSLASTQVSVAPLATLTVNGTLSSATQLTDNGTVTFAPGTTGMASNPVHVVDTLAGIFIGSNYAQSSYITGSLQVLLSTVGNRTVLYTSALAFAGGTDAWRGQLDLSNNDMIVHNGNLATVFDEIKTGYNYVGGADFAGQGIISTAAATDTTHLTTLGVILNTGPDGVTPLYGGPDEPLFDGIAPAPGDVLVKYTYYGDTNLDGKVDGSDYTNIDAAFAAGGKTGWFNGDFNYDGVIDGSDYSLIDNADNNQQAAISSLTASVTADVAGPGELTVVTAVPEPTAFAAALLIAIASRSPRRIAFRPSR
jgi:autotransporter-associated beta strand protein